MSKRGAGAIAVPVFISSRLSFSPAHLDCMTCQLPRKGRSTSHWRSTWFGSPERFGQTSCIEELLTSSDETKTGSVIQCILKSTGEKNRSMGL